METDMKDVRKRLSLRVWFIVAFLFLLLAPSMIVLVVTIPSSPNRHAQQPEGIQYTGMILNHVGSWTDRAWQSRLRALLSASSVQVRLLDSKNKTIFTYTPGQEEKKKSENYPQSNLLANEMNLYIDHPSVWMVQKHFIYERNKLVGIAEIRAPFLVNGPPVNTQAHQSFHGWLTNGPGGFYLWIFCFATAFSLIMVWIGKSFVSKMKGMSQAARKISLGDFEISLPTSAIREVNELSISLSMMRDHLNAALLRRDEIEQEKRIMIASIIHDLRTPIFTIIGHLEGMQKGIAERPEKVAEYLKICMDKSLLLNQLVSDLFVFSRLDNLDQPLHLEHVDWVLLIHQVLEGFQLMASEKNVELVHQHIDSSILLSGDPQLLTRAISNLLDNALRYTPKNGSITLRSTMENHQLLFAIEDTGSGFQAVDLEHIFKPFYRGDKSRNRSTGGVGLGLAITQRIVQAHKGTISAANSESHGAVISIHLPLV